MTQPDSADTTPHRPMPDCPAPADLAPLFPQLDILELIGRGGMGMVYKARQRSLDRLVALKVLPWSVDRGADLPERFEREARALARLQHPGIVAVHDSGRVGDWYYFVMEYVEGCNLRQAVAQERMSYADVEGKVHTAVVQGRVEPGVIVTILMEVCDALQHAHELGIIHRDVKPENILLLEARGAFKVADFGLAKMMQHGPQDHSLTATGQTMGTWHYMAPEQLERPQEVDHRADLYSAGVVLYELLTGERPVGHFAPPSKKLGGDTRFDAVVAKALARDPAERYQQAADLKAAVLAAWQAQPASAQTEPLPDWAAKMVQDAFAPGAQVHVHNQGTVQYVTSPPAAPVAHRHLTWSFLGKWALGFLGQWGVVGAAWLGGLPGLALAALSLTGAFLVMHRQALAHLPEMAESLAKLDGPTRGLRWALAVVLFLAGCAALMFTPSLAWDARVLQRTDETFPLDTSVMGNWRNGEWTLPADSREFFTNALPGPLAETRRRLHFDAQRDAATSYVVPELIWVVGLAGGAALLCLASLAMPGGRVFWTAGLSLAAVVALPFAVLPGVSALWAPPISAGRPLAPVVARGQDHVIDDVSDWARAEGYELFGGGEWLLSSPQKIFERLGRLKVYQARPASRFRRWRQGAYLTRSRLPDVLILIVTSDGRSTVQVRPVGFLTTNAPERFDAGLVQWLQRSVPPPR